MTVKSKFKTCAIRAMQTASTYNQLKQIKTQWAGAKTAFVPTMGALHDGHMALVRLAQERADKVVVSIFVNPTQFAPHEDFDAYPRDYERDAKMLEAAGVNALYLPNATEIYPNGPVITTRAGDAAKGLESDFRPHFFDGVCTVVRTLFDHVRPDVAVFGEKDYQQLMVIKEMVKVLSLPIEIIGAPIVRDEHGLALSSRNTYLSPEELVIARKMNLILRETASSLQPRPQAGGSNLEAQTGLPRRADALLAMTKELSAAGFDKVDYVEKRWGRILAAAYVGRTRLIDNFPLLSS